MAEERQLIITNDDFTYCTWYDMRAILSEMTVTPPEIKTSYVDIEGADGTLDLTSVLTDGEPRYKNRTGHFKLILTEGTYDERKAELEDFCKKVVKDRVTVVTPENVIWDKYEEADWGGYNFEGRVKPSYTLYPAYAELTLECDFDPRRYGTGTTYVMSINDGKENNFNFTNDGEKAQSLDYVLLERWTEDEGDTMMMIKMGDLTFELTGAGEYTLPGFLIAPGKSTAVVSGAGKLTVSTDREVKL